MATRPEPAPLPAFADADFEHLGEDQLDELEMALASIQKPLLSVAAPARLDPRRSDTLPVLLASRVNKHRRWDVQPQLNMIVAISDLVTGDVAFHFPFVSGKPVMPSGRSRFGPEPAEPWESAAFPKVSLLELPLGKAREGARLLATTALYFDWKSPTVRTAISGEPRAYPAEPATAAAWLMPNPTGDLAAPPSSAPASMVVQRSDRGVLVAIGRVNGPAGSRALPVTLLMLRRDDFTAHKQRIVLVPDAAGGASFAINLSMALNAGRPAQEMFYLIAGPEVIGPFAPDG
ncbi:hypothetical protein ABC347_17210 [Sphingomonas sp. 1P06PA]|uniref:hypothetical protein n=1 Tax=Sphingomonas sp. 1P06PA TaxID=554121 RepID=UPI0039A75502